MQREQLSQRIDNRMDLAALASLGSVISGAHTRLGRRLRRTAVQYHGAGLRLARAYARSSARRSCTMASKQPARSQRCISALLCLVIFFGRARKYFRSFNDSALPYDQRNRLRSTIARDRFNP